MPEHPTFHGFAREAITFLNELRTHNDRAWFTERKQIYEQEIKRPAKAFAEALAAKLEELTTLHHGHKIFRIHRDVRFSKDKTPYNTHLHIAFMPKRGEGVSPAWFFGLDPDKLTIGTGVFAFDKVDLERFRNRVLGPDGGELVGLMARLEGESIRFGQPDLKRIPSGYAKDHPNAELLRYKGFSAWIDHGDPTVAIGPTLPTLCIEDFGRLKPVFDWLRHD